MASKSRHAEPAIVATARAAGGSITTIRAAAICRLRETLSVAVSRLLTDDWRRRREQRIAATVDALLHPGVLADFERARRG
jgi:hypothetical protein